MKIDITKERQDFSKDIITEYDSLSERSDEVDVRKEGSLVQEIVLSLKDTIKKHNLTALAAPQIGYKKRIFCINFKGDIRTFINPIITNVKGFDLARERCESLPGKQFIRPRNNEINIIYQNPLGKSLSQKLLGLAAITFQEQLDHLDGMLLSDVGLEIDEDFDKASEDERAEVINAYLESLDLKQQVVEKEIEDNPELKQIQDAVNFMEDLQQGKVQLGKQVSIKVKKESENK